MLLPHKRFRFHTFAITIHTSIVPYASIDLTAYESFKSAYVKSTGREPTPSVHMVCGATSALISASIVYPLGKNDVDTNCISY